MRKKIKVAIWIAGLETVFIVISLLLSELFVRITWYLEEKYPTTFSVVSGVTNPIKDFNSALTGTIFQLWEISMVLFTLAFFYIGSFIASKKIDKGSKKLKWQIFFFSLFLVFLMLWYSFRDFEL